MLKNQMKLIKNLGMQYPKETSKRKQRYGLYECPICFKHFRTMTASVNSGKSTKCKSCSTTLHKSTHGMSNHKLYGTWSMEKHRCENSKHHQYKDYGGRGIKISEEFKNVQTWINHIESLPNAHRRGFTIDRIDNNCDYERGNLRWASRKTQARNTRKLMSTNSSGYRGVSRSKTKNKWISQIRVGKKSVYIGVFLSKEYAAIAYDDYILKHNLEHTMNKIAIEKEKR